MNATAPVRSFRISKSARSFTIVDGGAMQLALGGLVIAGMLAAALYVAFHL
ncbi:MAG: hypothetical protein ACYTEG_17555 [Planctomycetota bacterium]|jgi:hypothetical protein